METYEPTRLFIGAEGGGCGGNRWALALNLEAMTCRWGYHSRWMGTYDRSILTDGVLSGRVLSVDEAAGRISLQFMAPSLTPEGSEALDNDTFCVQDEARRRAALDRALSDAELIPVRFVLSVDQGGLYGAECHEEGLLPEQEGLWESGGVFLERAGGAFSSILKNEDLIKAWTTYEEPPSDGEEPFTYRDVSYSYAHGRAALPFGFHRQHLPLFDLSAPFNFTGLKPRYEAEANKKAPYRRMLLFNQALGLLNEPPRYDDAALEAAHAAFEHDTIAEENIAALKGMGVEVIHGVDPTTR